MLDPIKPVGGSNDSFTRVLRCKCDSGRAACDQGLCGRGQAINPPGNWSAAKLAQSGVVVTTGPEGLIPLKHYSLGLSVDTQPPESARTYAWAYWTETDVAVPAVPSATLTDVWKGFHWTWVKSFQGSPPDPNVVSDPANALLRQSINTMVPVNVRERAPGYTYRVCNTVSRRWLRLPPRPGTVAEVLRGDIFVDVERFGPTNAWRSFVADLPPAGASNRIDSAVANLVSDDTKVRTIVADDVPRTTAGHSAAVVQIDNGSLVYTLRYNTAGKLLTVLPAASATRPAAFGALAMSARRQELRSFMVNDIGIEMRTLGLDGLGDQTRTLSVEAKNIVAAAYRTLDDAYYLLDEGNDLRLLRIGANSNVDVVAVWPRSSGVLGAEQYTLTASQDGGLTLTTAGNLFDNACGVALSSDADGAFTSARLFRGIGKLYQAAHVGMDSRFAWVTVDAAGEKTFESKPLTAGEPIPVSGATACF